MCLVSTKGKNGCSYQEISTNDLSIFDHLLIDISPRSRINVKKNLGFRAWFYFRQGWSIYFAFAFAAINTMVTTYYLAIKNAPVLKDIFPSFVYYVLIITAIGIPILIAVGYLHTKRSYAYKAEADIGFEAHPHMRRMLLNTEEILSQHLKINEMIIKLSKAEKLSEKDLEDITNMNKELTKYIEKRTIKDKPEESQV